MSKLNLEHLALNRVREKYRHLRRGGFARAVRSLDVDLDDPLPFIPDAWFAMRLVHEDESEGVMFPRGWKAGRTSMQSDTSPGIDRVGAVALAALMWKYTHAQPGGDQRTAGRWLA